MMKALRGFTLCGTVHGMKYKIPSTAQVSKMLAPLTTEQIKQLARTSKVPAATLLKIKYSVTRNAGIDTVRKFIGHL